MKKITTLVFITLMSTNLFAMTPNECAENLSKIERYNAGQRVSSFSLDEGCAKSQTKFYKAAVKNLMKGVNVDSIRKDSILRETMAYEKMEFEALYEELKDFKEEKLKQGWSMQQIDPYILGDIGRSGWSMDKLMMKYREFGNIIGNMKADFYMFSNALKFSNLQSEDIRDEVWNDLDFYSYDDAYEKHQMMSQIAFDDYTKIMNDLRDLQSRMSMLGKR